MKGKEYGFPGKPFTESLDFGRFLWEGRMGTFDEFSTFFRLTEVEPPPIPPTPPEPPEPPEPPVEPFPEKVLITAGANLRLRDKPTVSNSATMGWCKDRTVWYPEGMTIDELGRFWYLVKDPASGGNRYFAEWLTEPME